MAHMLTPPDRDHPIGQRGAMGDRNGAMALAFGIAAALLKRTRTGPGRLSTSPCWPPRCGRCRPTSSPRWAGTRRRPSSGRGPFVNPFVGIYRTKDGRHIQLVFLEPDRYWADFCRVIGRDDLADDPRFADMRVRRENAEACVAELDEEFATPDL